MKLNRKTSSFLFKACLIIVLIGMITSCSRKQNKWLNRNFHAMGTYYNILYHGNLALEDGKEQIKETFVDDYWEILSVERIAERGEEIEYGIPVDIQAPVMPSRMSEEDRKRSMERERAPGKDQNDLLKKDDRAPLAGRDKDKDAISSAFGDFNQDRNNQDRPGQQGNQYGSQYGNNQYGNNRYGQGGQYGSNQYGGNRYGQGGQYGGGQYGGGQYGSNQYGSNQYGSNQYGSNQYGSNRYGQGGQYGGSQYGGGMPGNNQYGGGMPGNQYGSQYGGMAGSNQYGGGRSNQGQFGGNQYGGNQYSQSYGGNTGQFNQSGRQPAMGGNQFGGGNINQQMGSRGRGRGSANIPGFDPGMGGVGSAALGNNQQDMQTDPLSMEEALDRAEEKASKAIQKHNMLIGGIEYNPQMKEAFLLLGKARYYQKRYFPALEAFNYIINKYEDPSVLVAAHIWREKTYMRLENYDRVIKNLNEVLASQSDLTGENMVEVSTTLAQAYINTEREDQALEHMNNAINNTKDYDLKARFLFVKGQIFKKLEQRDSALVAFDQVIALKRKPPRKYMINSYMEKSSFFDFENGDVQAQLDTLQILLADRENRPFLDIINYGTAEFYKDLGDMPEAIAYYNHSLRTGTNNHGLKARIYGTLAEHYFDNAEYKTAGAYYDSTMVNLPLASLEYRTIRRKRINLADVIMFEEIAYVNDSILSLVAMSPEKREAHFKKYTDSIKADAIAMAQKAEKDRKKAKLNQHIFSQQPSSAGGMLFYFYDDAQVIAGKEVFRRVWGNRSLQDNWRTEMGSGVSDEKEEKQKEEEMDFLALIEQDPMFKVETYLSMIPEDEEIIRAITEDRDFAYYQLGIIYHEKFSEHELSAGRLEKLLTFEPDERLVLPAKYYLYKVYMELNQPDKAEQWKQNILANHPDSRYAELLRNPASLRDDKNNPIVIYNGIYKDYKEGKYQQVIDDCEENVMMFYGNSIVPKLELLKAMAVGRLYGFEAYKETLNYVALSFPQSIEGKKAEQIINETLPQLESGKFVAGTEGNYNLIYPFTASDRDKAEKLKEKLDKAIKEFDYITLSTSIDVYNPEVIFVVVRGLASKMGAEGFGDKLSKEKDYRINNERFGISSFNYEVVLIHKSLEEYRTEFVN